MSDLCSRGHRLRRDKDEYYDDDYGGGDMEVPFRLAMFSQYCIFGK